MHCLALVWHVRSAVQCQWPEHGSADWPHRTRTSTRSCLALKPPRHACSRTFKLSSSTRTCARSGAAITVSAAGYHQAAGTQRAVVCRSGQALGSRVIVMQALCRKGRHSRRQDVPPTCRASSDLFTVAASKVFMSKCAVRCARRQIYDQSQLLHLHQQKKQIYYASEGTAIQWTESLLGPHTSGSLPVKRFDLIRSQQTSQTWPQQQQPSMARCLLSDACQAVRAVVETVLNRVRGVPTLLIVVKIAHCRRALICAPDEHDAPRLSARS